MKFTKPKSKVKLERALWWLERGADLLPVQPNSKFLVGGFGLHRRHIQTPEEASFWFGNGRSGNLAVCAPGLLILDFDDVELYQKWCQGAGHLATTYTEMTRRGYHVFFSGPADFRVELVDSVELVRVCLVAPSRVKGFTYEPVGIDAPIMDVGDLDKTFSSLLSEKKIVPDAPVARAAAPIGDDLLSRIKGAVSVYDVASSLTELKKCGEGGRWWRGCCPLHDDAHPSFWLDGERGTWGCHGCGERGDVINLYALSRNLSVKQAIAALAGEVVSL